MGQMKIVNFQKLFEKMYLKMSYVKMNIISQP